MKKLEIICDMDAILVDLFGPWLAWYNETYKDALLLEMITEWEISKFVKEECGKSIMDFFHPERDHQVKPTLYRDIPALDGAVEGLQAIHEAGHDIIICSAVSGSTANEKYLWCAKHLPFLHHHNIFLGNRKERLVADILIDDGPHNIIDYNKRWGMQAITMGIAYPYNLAIRDEYVVYAEDFRDTRKAWETIVGAVQKVAESRA